MERQYLKAVGTKVSTVLLAMTLAMPTSASAEEIQLVSYDGSLRMTGALHAYSDGRYALETDLGILLVSTKLVDCEGAPCPPHEMIHADILAAGDVLSDQEISPKVASSK